MLPAGNIHFPPLLFLSFINLIQKTEAGKNGSGKKTKAGKAAIQNDNYRECQSQKICVKAAIQNGNVSNTYINYHMYVLYVLMLCFLYRLSGMSVSKDLCKSGNSK
jgi:hypothetical protein